MIQMQTGFMIASQAVPRHGGSRGLRSPTSLFSPAFDVRAEGDSQEAVPQNSEAISL